VNHTREDSRAIPTGELLMCKTRAREARSMPVPVPDILVETG
jgi:hypothetical protein